MALSSMRTLLCLCALALPVTRGFQLGSSLVSGQQAVAGRTNSWTRVRSTEEGADAAVDAFEAELPTVPNAMEPPPPPAEPLDDNIPGNIVVPSDVLAEQQVLLEKLSRQLRRERLDREAEEGQLIGFVEQAEINNGRAAMFGIAVGILTEYWTGESMPQVFQFFLPQLTSAACINQPETTTLD
ncbi:unnamed protein product [Chrysoparadoxa australica]